MIRYTQILSLILFTLFLSSCMRAGIDIIPSDLSSRDMQNLTQVEQEMLTGYTFETLIDEKILQAVKQMAKTLKPEYKGFHLGKYKLGFLEISDIDRKTVTKLHHYITEKTLTFSFLQPVFAKNLSIVERFLIEDILRELDFEHLYPPIVDQSLAQELGRIYHLDLIETGVTTETADFIDINLRMIETRRGRIVAVGSVKIEKTEPVRKWLDEMAARDAW
ncbi:Uncharacterized protein dnl_55220 [Desulfonema limicola]|uniref:FlgO domain-containing protein n=1 Tax=Desulfonema limicola TaxID=45656 RepID=A0A975GJM8_9BACT|nr:hypothetical protein [Desulfonema limicola]QTA83128.1 Uncharacterized protein dnl_55220 [Desulfonema limicola]